MYVCMYVDFDISSAASEAKTETLSIDDENGRRERTTSTNRK